MQREIDDEQLRQLIFQGVSQREIARRTGIPRSTVQGHLKRLQLVPARSPDPRPVQKPVQTIDTDAVHSADTGAVQTFDTGPVQRLNRLEDEVVGLHQLMQSVIDRLDQLPVQTPVQITASPTYPPGKAVRWNLWILDAIRDDVATLAAQRGLSPSQMVQELLWKALVDSRSS